MGQPLEIAREMAIKIFDAEEKSFRYNRNSVKIK